MPRLLRYRRFFSLLALLAVLLGALAPTVTFLKAASEGRKLSFAEICTATGIKRIAVDAAQLPGDTPGHVSAGLDCPYCATHAGSFALLNTHSTALLLPRLDEVTPLLFLHAPATLHAWSAQQARAPPAHS